MQTSDRHPAAALLLLAFPLFIYGLAYLFPLVSMGSLSVDNSGIANRLPSVSARFGEDREDRDAIASALLTDLSALPTAERAEVARLLNQEFGGFRSLLIKTGNNAARITPTARGLAEFDKRWEEDGYWETLERNVGAITWRHFQKATGFKPDAAGSYALVPGGDIYLLIMWRTLVIGLQVTALSLVLGYPLAYAAACGPVYLRNTILLSVLLSFWISILVRTTAWVVLLQTNGIVNGLLLKLGIVAEPLQLIFNRFGVVVTMTHVLLPFAVLPIYNVMRTISSSQADASRSLGASPVRTFLSVYFPQTLRGVIVGGGSVFVLTLGFYITPALTGGPRDQMLSYYIADFVQRGLDWGVASVLSIMLIAAILILLLTGAGLMKALTLQRKAG